MDKGDQRLVEIGFSIKPTPTDHKSYGNGETNPDCSQQNRRSVSWFSQHRNQTNLSLTTQQATLFYT